jgi:CheY-like chemotaxis protein
VRDPVTGRSRGVTDVIRDITERKALEADLSSAKAEAEAAAAVKSEFLANMSHELRTPLTSILGFSELLKTRMASDPEARRYLQLVSDASQVLLATVNDILDFSKLEAGQVEIDVQAADPAAVCDAVVHMLSPQADEKGLGLRFRATSSVPQRVLLDDTRVRQILLNLTSNAVKFTEKGQVSVALSYDENAEILRCEVVDTGPGIPADRLDRLFRRFSQVDASTTRSHGGTGLGLAICKGLAEAMGGAVGANSTLGQGSCFWFELPCPALEGVTTQSDAGTDQASFDGLAGVHLLVVDDNAMNRELVRIMMSSVGARVTEAASGDEALALSETEAFDAILMDIRMAGLAGPDAARAIRHGRGPNASSPIFAFTADAEQDSDASTWGDAFTACISKPLVASELFEAISRQLGARITRLSASA